MSLKVITTGAESTIYEALGMTKARCEALIKIAAGAFRDAKSLTDTLEESSRYAENANELAYMAYVIGKMHQVNQEQGVDSDAVADAVLKNFK